MNDKYSWGRYKSANLPYIQFRDIMAFIVNPLKDFVIAMCFTLLYYYQGKTEQLGPNKGALPIGVISSDLRKSNELDNNSDNESKDKDFDI